MRRALAKDLLLICLLGLTAMYWAESHWLAGSSHTLGWASAYNRSLMDSLLGAPSSSPSFSIPEWMAVIWMVALWLPMWRRLHRLGS